MRPVPPTYQEFRAKWDYICNNVLEMTPAAERAVIMATSRNIERIPEVPSFIWKLGRLPASEFVRVLAIGGLPEDVRRRFDIPWSSLDDFRLDAVEMSVRNGWRFIHPKLRYHPRARAGNRNARLAA